MLVEQVIAAAPDEIDVVRAHAIEQRLTGVEVAKNLASAAEQTIIDDDRFAEPFAMISLERIGELATDALNVRREDDEALRIVRRRLH